MSWFIFALLSAIFFASALLLARKLTVKSHETRAFSFLYNITGAFLSLSFFLIEPWNFRSPSLKIILLTFLAVLLYGIFERTHFYVRKHTEASVFTIFFELSPVITFLAAVLFLNENLTFIKILAAFLIVSGNVLVVFKRTNVKLNKNFLASLIILFSFGLVRVLDKEVSTQYPLQLYIFMVWFFPSLFVFLPKIKISSLQRELKIASWRILLLSFLNVSGYYLLIKAFQTGEASRVTFVSSTSSIMAVLAAIILLNEKTSIVKKIIAATMVSAGAFLLR